MKKNIDSWNLIISELEIYLSTISICKCSLVFSIEKIAWRHENEVLLQVSLITVHFKGKASCILVPFRNHLSYCNNCLY